MGLFNHNFPNKRARQNDKLPALVRTKVKKIKDYNFKNPDKFSKDHLKVLGSIHEHFCRQVSLALNSMLRLPMEFSVANVQQLTYGDFIDSMPEDLITGVLNMYPLVTQFCIGLERHLIGAIMDRLLGGSGVSSLSGDELTDVEVGIIKDTFRRILHFMPEGWQALIPATDDVELVALEATPSAAQIAAPSDIVALITINVEVGSDLGLMSVCIPYSALEDVIVTLSRQSTYRNDKLATEDSRDFIISKLANSPMPVKIVLARGELKLNEVMGLQAGDIIKLNTELSAKSEIWIGEELKYLGRPGQISNNFTVAISEEYEEDLHQIF
ncbi:MAG: FliM/FliN family flagellar motor switch protein [Candidatus Caenarcaniphilales bacterium]|jgi:flagellar motor switch protein FliM|nr:FliM/FliN family flagellar motor switch protein [Candidatus Caenarcaniphilales bacterium]